jgi:alpha-1,6-mannosyltransferase
VNRGAVARVDAGAGSGAWSSLRRDGEIGQMQAPHISTGLVDTTMLYAPESGGVKRYLKAKRAWFAERRPAVRHALVLPGPRNAYEGDGVWSIYTAPLPFGKGYRWPLSRTAWMRRLARTRPSLIEAGDPYTPGLAALRAGQMLDVPVIGFCHTDLPALAGAHLGEWAEEPVRRRWAAVYRRFDAVFAPSCWLARRLNDSGVGRVEVVPLGVDVAVFSPERAQRDRVRRMLDVAPDEKLLVFAGRPAAEKRVGVLVEAVERLGRGWRLLLIGAGAAGAPSDRVRVLPYQHDAALLAALLASCDAFVHANPCEALGLVVLEAMACGLPVVGVAGGGVAEVVDDSVGRLARRPDAGALAEAVDALFAGDAEALGRDARACAVERYSWDRTFETACAHYARLTGDPAFLAAPAPPPVRPEATLAGRR